MTVETDQYPPDEVVERLDARLGGESRTRVRRLSFAQEQLWFLDQLAPGETTYNILMAWRLRGPLRADLLQRSLTAVVARHESLRVTINAVDGTPFQTVSAPGEVPLPVIDLRSVPESEREQKVRAAIDKERATRFDLATGPLCRFQLYRLGSDEYVFCQGFHHVVMDGWSAALFNAELSSAYASLLAGAPPVFAPAELDYTEFAHAQRERLQGEVLAEELAYWQRALAGLPRLDLPADRPRPVGGRHRGRTLISQFPDDLRELVRQLAEDHGASLFMVFAAAFNLVLSRYSGLEDVPVGVPMLGRPEPALESVVGMFINMVVLRSDLVGDPTFGEFLERVAEANLDLYEHQEVAFNQVVDAVQPVRDPDRNPLFQVSIQLLGESTSGENLRLPAVTAEFVPLAPLSSRFDLAVNLVDTGSALRAAVEYSTDLFDAWRIEAMLGHLETVLRAAAADPGRRLSQITIMDDAETARLLDAGRGQAADAIGRLPSQPPAVTGAAPADPRVYVVDKRMNLVPRGVTGELLIADAGDPSRPQSPARRTGRLARWTHDLRLEVLGDAGGQVALDASRLEPSEQDTVAPNADGEPRTATERSVAGIFGDVLGLERVGADDGFFSIGGNSLQAMRAVSRINKGFGIKLSVRTLYGNVTVRAVSAAVDRKLAEPPAAAGGEPR